MRERVPYSTKPTRSLCRRMARSMAGAKGGSIDQLRGEALLVLQRELDHPGALDRLQCRIVGSIPNVRSHSDQGVYHAAGRVHPKRARFRSPGIRRALLGATGPSPAPPAPPRLPAGEESLSTDLCSRVAGGPNGRAVRVPIALLRSYSKRTFPQRQPGTYLAPAQHVRPRCRQRVADLLRSLSC